MKVLVVEDSLRMAKSIEKGLKQESFGVDISADGEQGLQLALSGEYDVVLLDINMPKLDGLAVIRELRATRSDVPVILITARDGVRDRIVGLDCGADDYLTKPFSFEELLARMRAVMRRTGSRTGSVVRYADVELDPARGIAMRGGERLMLSSREFGLLRVLMARVDQVLSRSVLYESVWEDKYDGTSNVLDVYVNYLRNKLESSSRTRLIHSVRGVGYQFGREP